MRQRAGRKPVLILLWTIAIITASGILASCFAHEFYSWECCSGKDCAPISSSRVKLTTSGYLVDNIHKIPYAEAKQSPDGQYHACFPTPTYLRCLYAPPMSF